MKPYFPNNPHWSRPINWVPNNQCRNFTGSNFDPISGTLKKYHFSSKPSHKFLHAFHLSNPKLSYKPKAYVWWIGKTQRLMVLHYWPYSEQLLTCKAFSQWWINPIFQDKISHLNFLNLQYTPYTQRIYRKSNHICRYKMHWRGNVK